VEAAAHETVGVNAPFPKFSVTLFPSPVKRIIKGRPFEVGFDLSDQRLQAGGAAIETYLIFRVAAPSRFFEGAEGLVEEWCARRDSNSRPSGS
jgi:hypothetical protein